jgi:peptidyl-prolyl isomerase G (cyclophilin G)
VFGRVIRGYDVVEKIVALPVDNKDRPLTPIVISNCGELELRKPPGSCSRQCRLNNVTYFCVAKAEPEQKSRARRRDRSRSPSSSRPRSPSRSPSREGRHRKKKFKRRRGTTPEVQDVEKSKAREHSLPLKSSSDNTLDRKETEEEYDARLEREENERIEEQRRRELERLKAKYESQADTVGKDGVRYKGEFFKFHLAAIVFYVSIVGRGRMKFIDPETHQRKIQNPR